MHYLSFLLHSQLHLYVLTNTLTVAFTFTFAFAYTFAFAFAFKERSLSHLAEVRHYLFLSFVQERCRELLLEKLRGLANDPASTSPELVDDALCTRVVERALAGTSIERDKTCERSKRSQKRLKSERLNAYYLAFSKTPPSRKKASPDRRVPVSHMILEIQESSRPLSL